MDEKVLNLFAVTASRQPARTELARAVAACTHAGVSRPVDLTGLRGTAINNEPLSAKTFAALLGTTEFPSFVSVTGAQLEDDHPGARALVEAIWTAYLFRWLSPEGDAYVSHPALEVSWSWRHACADPGLRTLLLSGLASQSRRIEQHAHQEGSRRAQRAKSARSELAGLGVVFEGNFVPAHVLDALVPGEQGLHALLLLAAGSFKLEGLVSLLAVDASAEALATRLGSPVMNNGVPALLLVLNSRGSRSDAVDQLFEDLLDTAFRDSLLEEARSAATDPLAWVEAGPNREVRRRRALHLSYEMLTDLYTGPRVAKGTPQPTELYYRLTWLLANQDAMTTSEQVEFFSSCTQPERIAAVRQPGAAQAFFADLLLRSHQAKATQATTE